MGIELTKPAALTPGMPAMASTMAFSMRAARRLSGSIIGGIAIRAICNDCGSVKPGSTFRSAANVRIMSPELTSNTSASAT
jgi:hypothetical protein